MRDRGFPVVRVKDMDLPALVIGMDPRYFPVEDLWFREDMRYFDHVLGPCWAPERCGLVGGIDETQSVSQPLYAGARHED